MRLTRFIYGSGALVDLGLRGTIVYYTHNPVERIQAQRQSAERIFCRARGCRNSGLVGPETIRSPTRRPPHPGSGFRV